MSSTEEGQRVLAPSPVCEIARVLEAKEKVLIQQTDGCLNILPPVSVSTKPKGIFGHTDTQSSVSHTAKQPHSHIVIKPHCHTDTQSYISHTAT